MPAATEEATAMVMLDVPLPVIDVGLKVTVTPEGWPEAESVTAESNPPVTVLVMVEPPELPACTETEPGDAESVKPGCVDTDPASALMRAACGLPQPLARSYPVVAE